MKPFNLEAAKAGKPVVTKDGRKARIICFDAKGNSYQIVALAETSLGFEGIYTYTLEGKHFVGNIEDTEDLFMASEKKEAWVNIYKGNGIGTLFNTEEEAKSCVSLKDKGYITTIKIEWEE